MEATATPGLPMVVTTFDSATSRPGGGGTGQPHGRGNHAGLEEHGFLEIFALGLLQEADLVFAHFDNVAVAQLLACDGLGVDIGAVGAAHVFDFHPIVGHVDDGVLTADGKVVDDDVVVGAPAQRGALLGQLDLFDDDAVDRNDHSGHDPLLVC